LVREVNGKSETTVVNSSRRILPANFWVWIPRSAGAAERAEKLKAAIEKIQKGVKQE